MVCDTLGRPLRFMLTAGQRHDSLTAKALLDGFRAEAVLADRACDNNALRQTIAGMNAEASLRQAVYAASAERWWHENAEALAASNAWINENELPWRHIVPSDGAV